jgi:hypothetical protein
MPFATFSVMCKKRQNVKEGFKKWACPMNFRSLSQARIENEITLDESQI